MIPKLIVISGPDRGKSVLLEAAQYSLGRGPESDFALTDPSVSRHHARVTKISDDGVLLADDDSLHGTFVNGIPVMQKQLEHGDQIDLGRSTVLFLSGADATQEPQITESIVDATLPLQSYAAVFPHTLGRFARDLNAFLKVANSILLIAEPNQLASELLRVIFEVIPADFGAIAIFRFGSTDAREVFSYRRAADVPDVNLSDEVTRSTLLCEGVYRDNLGEDGGVMATRLCALDRPLGFLYLVRAQGRFMREHGEFLRAMSGIAGVALENALTVRLLRAENQQLKQEIQGEHRLIGESARIKEIFSFISRVAQTNATILIRGETGTGKELVARAIHQASPRREHVFVGINCASLSETLLETELFGHEKGAFTGAITQKKGKFEVADRGTVFLDEIGEMPLSLQAKLLRALQEREFERVGGTRPIRVDLRILAATNRDLEQAITAGKFRADLFYRLNVVSVQLPTLRERPDDILLLANYFVAKHAKKADRQLAGISRGARDVLLSYSWPGNIRELENAIEHAVVLGSADLIMAEDLPTAMVESLTAPTFSGYNASVNAFKKDVILRTVADAQGDYVRAAAVLEIHVNNLHRLIRNLGIKAEIQRLRKAV